MLLLALSLLSPGAQAASFDTLCVWKGVQWEHYATLMSSGSRTPTARLLYNEDASVDAKLGYDADGALRMRARLQTEEFELNGELRFNEDELLSLAGDAVALGQSGTLLTGGDLQLVAVSAEQLVISASPLAQEGLELWDAHALVGCHQLSLLSPTLPWEDSELLALAGLESLGTVLLTKRSPLRPAPSARSVGRVSPFEDGREVELLEEQGAWSHVAIPHWSGAVWQGWVKTRALSERGSSAVGMGGLGMRGVGKPETVRRCAEDIDLAAEVEGEVFPLGVVKAGTPIMVGEAAGDWVEAEFYRSWVNAVEGGRLLVEEDVMGCEVGPLVLPEVETAPEPETASEPEHAPAGPAEPDEPLEP